MNHPYLITSHPDSADFVAALQRSAKDGRAIQLERLVGGGHTYAVCGTIISVTPQEDRCLVQHGDREPRSYWIRYFFRMVNADGTTVENRPALLKHEELAVQRIHRRGKLAEDSNRALNDINFIPDASLSTSTFIKNICGTINGRVCDFYAFKGNNRAISVAIVYAKNKADASRCMKLLDCKNNIWDVFAIFLKAHFFGQLG